MTAENPGTPGSVALQRMCVACVDLLGVTGAGVSLMTGGSSGATIGVSGELAARVEEWQFSLGEGPCREALANDRPIMVADLADGNGHAAQWPVFGETVQEVGIRAIFAFPFRLGGRPIGVLDLFRDRAGLLSREQMRVASALADLAGTLLDLDPAAIDQNTVEEPAYRFEVHQATGMVAAQLSVSAQEALARLRARAFAQERTVSELAADVVNRRIRFAEEDL